MYSPFAPIFAKLDGVSPKNIVVVADYDLTLAEKDVRDFDQAPLTAAHVAGLQTLTPLIDHFLIVTARGEKSAMRYLTEKGRIANLSLASNSGHYFRENIANPGAKPVVIPVPGYDPCQLNTVLGGITYIMNGLKKRFPDITIDAREMCGAAIYNFAGDKKSKIHQSFHDKAYELKIEIHRVEGPEIADRILFEGKSREVKPESVATGTQGYIDFKPEGLSKRLATETIFRDHHTITNETVFIVAGDSAPDYAMIQAAASLVPRERVIGISVGDGLRKHEKKLGVPESASLLDAVFHEQGPSPVETLHKLFATIAHDATKRDPRIVVPASAPLWKPESSLAKSSQPS